MALMRPLTALLVFTLSSLMSSIADETIPCQKLPDGVKTTWTELQQILAKRRFLVLGQSWLAAKDPLFMPASVSTAWDKDYVYVYGDLEDHDTFNPSEGLNEPHYQKGDIFEVLIRPQESEAYFEFHVTPHDQVMQLRFPHKTSLADFRDAGGKPENLIPTFQIGQQVVETHAEIRGEENRWTVLLKIPARAIAPEREFREGDVLLFSFCRYDYTQGTAAPVLSSTSPYTVCSFHRQEEWRRMVLGR
jgi:hypothetical protein